VSMFHIPQLRAIAASRLAISGSEEEKPASRVAHPLHCPGWRTEPAAGRDVSVIRARSQMAFTVSAP